MPCRMPWFSAAEMKFTVKHWLMAVAFFAVAHRIFLSPFFWLAFYPWAWLCHADWIFTETGRRFDKAMPGSVFCVVAGVLFQAALLGGAVTCFKRDRRPVSGPTGRDSNDHETGSVG